MSSTTNVIEGGSSPGIRGSLKQLHKYRELLLMIVYRDIRIRYKQSIMGLLWALFMPTIIVIAGVVVRYGYSIVANKPMGADDIASVAVRSLPWAFVVSAIRFGTLSLIGNGNLISKIYFPKEVFPIAAVITALFDFSVAAAAMTVLLIFLGVGVSVYLAWVPVLLFILFVLVCGLVFIFSAAGLFFRDVKYLVEAGLTFGIFFTPVFFSAATFGKIGNYMLLNPVAPILEAMDAVVIGQHGPDLAWVGYSAAFAVLSLLLGFKFFKNLEPAFAENI